jgi:parvulin-like peptidyl-prolyl isomerase
VPDDHRQQSVVRLGFLALPVVAVLMLAGVVGSTYYAEHLAPVASVNGTGISRDEWVAQEKVDAFRLGQQEQRIRSAQAAGQLDPATAQADLQYVRQQVAAIPSAALQQLIDRVLQEKLAAQMGVTVSSAEVDAQLRQAAITAEQREVLAIFVAPGASPAAAPVPGVATPSQAAIPSGAGASPGPVASAGAAPKASATRVPGSSSTRKGSPAPSPRPSPSPSPSATPVAGASAAPGASPAPSPGGGGSAQQAQAQALADQALAELQAGTPFGQVARTFSTDPSAVNGGHYGYVWAGDPIDPAWVAALFALPVGGTTQVILGADGVYRIGRVTAVVPPSTDPHLQQELSKAGVSLAAYRDALRGDLVRQKLAAKILLQASTGAIEQVHAWEIRIASGSGSAARVKAVQEALMQPGADFAALARVNSDAPGADSGGDMGWIAPDQLSPPVQAVLFGLRVGEVSRPVTEADGTWLYMVSERAERPVDATQLAALRESAFTNWYEAQLARASIWRSAGTLDETAGSEGSSGA